MKRDESIDEKIVGVVYKLILDRTLDKGEDALLRRWLGSSVYYRNLLEDIQSDRILRNKLLEAYVYDRDEFWKIVVTYKAALP